MVARQRRRPIEPSNNGAARPRGAAAGRRSSAKGQLSPAREVVVSAQLRQPASVLGPRANRTIARILDATRQILLTRGYAGTTIDEIATAAGVSRASFYTYFPSKRDAMLALGANAVAAATEVIEALREMPPAWGVDDLEVWARQCFKMEDEYGSFAFAWTQAAYQDVDLRRAGTRGHLDLCRQLGEAMASLGDTPLDDPVERGLLVFSMLERSWMFCHLYTGTLDAAGVYRSFARSVAALILDPSPEGRVSRGAGPRRGEPPVAPRSRAVRSGRSR